MVAAMNILHVIASLAPESGGPAKACFEMARAVARRGHRVAIFATDHGAAAGEAGGRSARDGVEIRFFPRQFPKFFATSWPLARALLLEVGGADVVHLHSLYRFHDWAAARACRRHGVPYILRPHGTLDPYQFRQHRLRKHVMEALFQNSVTRRAAAIHYTAEDEMRISTPYALGAPGAVVPLGLDLEEYRDLPAKGSFRAAHPEVGARPIILFLGRLHRKKGLDVLARAFAQSVRRDTDAHLVIAGPDAGMAAAVRRILEENGVAERATFTGMVQGEEKLALLADADLFVLPSWSENFGLAIAEALAVGVPVLISEHVNIWREIEAAGCGRVVPVDAARVAAGMAEMLREPAKLRAMGELGKRLIAERFVWPRVGAALEQLYARVAERRLSGMSLSAAARR
jgi:glycosyltransferase involved in cell wall biosynthesis